MSMTLLVQATVASLQQKAIFALWAIWPQVLKMHAYVRTWSASRTGHVRTVY